MSRSVSTAVHQVTSSDAQTLVVESASGPGIPIVLLHGLSQQRHFWDPVTSYLEAPWIAIDQRGHGQSDTPVESDYAIERCARDVIDVLDARGVDRAVLIGHSWGAWVAARAAAAFPDRVTGSGLIDGALRSPADLGDRDEVLERLRPPVLDIPADELWARIAGGDLGPYLNESARAALEHTFVESGGRLRTRIGMDRHMSVLAALLDYDATEDIRARAFDTHAVIAGTRANLDERVLERLDLIGPGLHLQAWPGAIHDVPLQWPALVAGWIASVHAAACRATESMEEAS